MQNEDKKWRGLEDKLRRLQPREIDEASFDKLLACLDEEQVEVNRQTNEGNYPANVLWMRFAPVAAAAGVVLLGTFFLRYESRMDTLQAQRNDAHSAVGSQGGKDAVFEPVPESNLAGLGALPVPRLGMGGGYGAGFHSPDMNLLPVSAQDYLLPVEGLGIQEPVPLGFEDAYLWREGLGSDPGRGKEKPAAKTQ